MGTQTQHPKIEMKLPSGGKISIGIKVEDGGGKLEQSDIVASTALGAAAAATGSLVAISILGSTRSDSSSSFKESYEQSVAFGPDKSIKMTTFVDLDMPGQFSKRDINDLVLGYIVPVAQQAATSYAGNRQHFGIGLSPSEDIVSRIDESLQHNHGLFALSPQMEDEARRSRGRQVLTH